MPITMQFATDSIGKKYKEYATDHRILVEGQLKVADLQDALRADGVDLARSGDEQKELVNKG